MVLLFLGFDHKTLAVMTRNIAPLSVSMPIAYKDHVQMTHFVQPPAFMRFESQ